MLQVDGDLSENGAAKVLITSVSQLAANRLFFTKFAKQWPTQEPKASEPSPRFRRDIQEDTEDVDESQIPVE
uniref:RNA_pol_Rpc82 domain-containing protein n=1 Tax=Bursaphelenchus xylophilus TaxID=6326 RepID=A0A1I7SNC4_BURXY